jgi:hypothetical protein
MWDLLRRLDMWDGLEGWWEGKLGFFAGAEDGEVNVLLGDAKIFHHEAEVGKVVVAEMFDAKIFGFLFFSFFFFDQFVFSSFVFFDGQFSRLMQFLGQISFGAQTLVSFVFQAFLELGIFFFQLGHFVIMLTRHVFLFYFMFFFCKKSEIFISFRASSV